MSQFGDEFFNLSPEMLCVFNARGEFHDLNPSWEKNLGWDINDLRSTKFSTLLHSDDVDLFNNELAKLIKFEGHVTSGFESRYRHRDGGYRWLQWSASPIKKEKLILCVVRDITLSKRESLILHETQEVSRVGSWEIDLATNELLWSKMTHEIHETDPESYLPMLKDGLSFFSEDSKIIMGECIERLLKNGEGYSLDLPFVTAKKRNTWVRCVARASMRDGVVIRVYGTIEDISLKMREKSRYETIIENGNYGTWDWDLDTNSVIFNDRFCSIIGLDVKTIKHELATWDYYTHPEDKIKTYQDIEDHLTGKTPYYRNVHRMKHVDGHWVWILDQGKVVEYRDGKPVRFSGTHTDITYLKELEAESVNLKTTKAEQDRLFETIINNIPIMMVSSDQNGKINWVNPQFTQTLGWGLDDLGNMNEMPKNFFSSDNEEIAAVKFLNEASADEWREFNFFKKNGEPTHSLWAHVKLTNGSVVSIGQDIAEKKRQDELIKNQQARIISSAKLSSLGEMASGIAHEINNPLAIIKGKAYYILKKLEAGEIDVPFLIKEISKIEQNSLRIVKIIKGLRTFSRQGEGDPFQVVTFNSLLDDVLELCYERFKYQGVLLKTSGDLSSEILCQETQLAQVLFNLINNAYDAVYDQIGPWVEVNVEKTQDIVRISITDSGLGISSEIAEKIMQPFFTTKEVGVGTGLGLSISKGIVEMHNGHFYLDQNCPNTRFVIELPVKV